MAFVDIDLKEFNPSLILVKINIVVSQCHKIDMIINKRGLVLGITAVVLTTAALIIPPLLRPPMRFSQTQAFFRDSPKELVDEVWQIIFRQYVDATFNGEDWEKIREDYLEREYSDKEEAYDAIREMLEILGDPYTRFMDPT